MQRSTGTAHSATGDRILVYLRKARENPFGQGNTPASVRIIAQDLGLSKEAAYHICADLADRHLLQEIRAGGQYPYYRA